MRLRGVEPSRSQGSCEWFDSRFVLWLQGFHAGGRRDLVLRGETVLIACSDEVAEERMRLEWLGFELGVELAAEEEWVRGDLYDFDVGRVGRGAGEAKSGAGEDGLVLAVELVTVAMTFADLCFAVGVGGEGVGLHDAVPGS